MDDYRPEFEYSEEDFVRDLRALQTMPNPPTRNTMLPLFLRHYPMMREAEYKMVRVVAALAYIDDHPSEFARWRRVFPNNRVSWSEQLFIAAWRYFSGLPEEWLRERKVPHPSVLVAEIAELEASNPHKSHLPPEKGRHGDS